MPNRWSAQRIAHLRTSLKFTQDDLALWLGISKGSVSKLEAGRHPPSGPVTRLLNLLECFSTQLPFKKLIEKAEKNNQS